MRLLRSSVEKTDSMVAFTFVVKKEGKSWHATRVAAETEEEGEAIEASADDTYRRGRLMLLHPTAFAS